MLKASIYLVENIVTGDTYIGVTKRPVEVRWRSHVYTSRTRPKTRLHTAIAKYGSDKFSVTKIVTCLSLDTASMLEQEIIKDRKPTYNQTNGGQFTVGKRVSKDVVDRIRASNTGKKRSPEQRSNVSKAKKKQYADRPDLLAKAVEQLKAARLSINKESHKLAVSNASRSRVWAAESRAKLSASCTGRIYKHLIRPVECVTLKTVFDSAEEAAKMVGLSLSSVRHAALGYRKKAGGLEFRYV